MTARSIRIFLADGSPTGLRTAEIGLSTTVAVMGPRASFSEMAARDEVQRTGVYVLVGPDPDDPLLERVYVGEGDNVLDRLRAHNKDESKQFWDRALVFVSKDLNLTKAHVRHLEAELVAKAKRAKRSTIANGNEPSGGVLPEADRAEMALFLEQVSLLAAVLGVRAFETAPTPIKPGPGPIDRDEPPVWNLEGPGYAATCRILEGEFVVQAGSTARIEHVPSMSKYAAAARKQMLDSGVLRHHGDSFVFTQDYAFSSPSSAADVVAGASKNGRVAWRLADGTTYADWEERG